MCVENSFDKSDCVLLDLLSTFIQQSTAYNIIIPCQIIMHQLLYITITKVCIHPHSLSLISWSNESQQYCISVSTKCLFVLLAFVCTPCNKRFIIYIYIYPSKKMLNVHNPISLSLIVVCMHPKRIIILNTKQNHTNTSTHCKLTEIKCCSITK